MITGSMFAFKAKKRGLSLSAFGISGRAPLVRMLPNAKEITSGIVAVKLSPKEAPSMADIVAALAIALAVLAAANAR